MLKNTAIANALIETIKAIMMTERPRAAQYKEAARALRQAAELCRLEAERLGFIEAATAEACAEVELTYEPISADKI